MSEHKISLEWKRTSADFGYDSYSRDHAVVYGDNSRICASAAPEYKGNPSCFNPEQAFVTSLASCHMLTFLALASKKGYTVDKYDDSAKCILGRNAAHKVAITRVELAPEVLFSGPNCPGEEAYAHLHQQAHDACFIANSIASCIDVVVVPSMKRA